MVKDGFVECELSTSFLGIYVKPKKTTSGKIEDDHLQVGQREEVLDFSFIPVSFHPSVSFYMYKSHHGILDWALASSTLGPLGLFIL